MIGLVLRAGAVDDMKRQPMITHFRVKQRLDKAIRLSTELAAAIQALQTDMGEFFPRQRARPLAERNRRIANLLRIDPNLVVGLRALATQLAEIRAKFDRRPDDEAWLKQQLSHLEWPPGK